MARFEFAELAQSLVATRGLHRSSSGSVYGAINGQPVHVASTVDGNGHKFVSVIVATVSRSSAAATRDRWVESIGDVRKGFVKIDDATVTARFSHGKVGSIGNAQFATLIDQLASIAAAEGQVVPARPNSRPGLVNGLPRYLSEIEAGELSFSGRQAAAEYENLKPSVANGLGMGLAGMIAAALVWAALAVILDRQFWIAGIGAGLLIGYLVLYGAGKTNVGMQVLIGVLTVASVILGQFLSVAWVVHDELGIFDVQIVLDVYREAISLDPGSFMFALAGGLIGAWYGARLARKPAIEPQIEMAPA